MSISGLTPGSNSGRVGPLYKRFRLIWDHLAARIDGHLLNYFSPNFQDLDDDCVDVEGQLTNCKPEKCGERGVKKTDGDRWDLTTSI